jgi:hypothetical protein
MNHFKGLGVVGGLLLALCAGCEGGGGGPSGAAPVEDQGDERDVVADVVEDATPDATPDVVADVVADVPDVERPEAGARVEIALEPWLEGGQGEGPVRIYAAASGEDLLGGEVTQGRVGDWVLENERVRLVVEGDDRAIGPCPWGGNIVDAATRLPGGGWGEDVTGEICLLVNVGRTLRPERYEVLRDGSGGGAGVLAVTGRLELLDFIHIIGMALGRVPVELELPVDPDAELPLTVTFYYILRPGDQGARVVVALRNDSDARVPVALSHLMNSGGAVSFFNPLNERKGFGYKGLGVDNLQSTPLPFLAFQGERGGFAYVPEAREGLSQGGLPLGGSYVAISGVAVSWLGATDIFVGVVDAAEELPAAAGGAGSGPRRAGAGDVLAAGGGWLIGDDGGRGVWAPGGGDGAAVGDGEVRGGARGGRAGERGERRRSRGEPGACGRGRAVCDALAVGVGVAAGVLARSPLGRRGAGAGRGGAGGGGGVARGERCAGVGARSGGSARAGASDDQLRGGLRGGAGLSVGRCDVGSAWRRCALGGLRGDGR